jgi:ribosomal protein L37AE/L43A
VSARRPLPARLDRLLRGDGDPVARAIWAPLDGGGCARCRRPGLWITGPGSPPFDGEAHLVCTECLPTPVDVVDFPLALPSPEAPMPDLLPPRRGLLVRRAAACNLAPRVDVVGILATRRVVFDCPRCGARGAAVGIDDAAGAWHCVHCHHRGEVDDLLPAAPDPLRAEVLAALARLEARERDYVDVDVAPERAARLVALAEQARARGWRAESVPTPGATVRVRFRR